LANSERDKYSGSTFPKNTVVKGEFYNAQKPQFIVQQFSKAAHFRNPYSGWKESKAPFNPKSRHENATKRVECLHDAFIEIFVILQWFPSDL
jgi:hypothetical protein